MHALAVIDQQSSDANGVSFSMHNEEPACLFDDCIFLDVVPPAGIDITEAKSMTSLNFKQKVTLRFYNTRVMTRKSREEAERQAEQDALKEAEEERLMDEKRLKYKIVERIRAEIAIKDAAKQVSLVDSYAQRAQAEFTQISMKELRESGNYSCPPKYLN